MLHWCTVRPDLQLHGSHNVLNVITALLTIFVLAQILREEGTCLQIAHAYEVLSEPEQRKIYDQVRTANQGTSQIEGMARCQWSPPRSHACFYD
jgi:predicted Zn-ribbon and HTH transcriptional regulator